MITVYSKNTCPFCDRAKALLENKGVAFNVVNIEEAQDAREFLVDQGLRSVPQIFIEDAHVGGLNELKEYLK
jgi:glutaredoxin 3